MNLSPSERSTLEALLAGLQAGLPANTAASTLQSVLSDQQQRIQAQQQARQSAVSSLGGMAISEAQQGTPLPALDRMLAASATSRGLPMGPKVQDALQNVLQTLYSPSGQSLVGSSSTSLPKPPDFLDPNAGDIQNVQKDVSTWLQRGVPPNEVLRRLQQNVNAQNGPFAFERNAQWFAALVAQQQSDLEKNVPAPLREVGAGVGMAGSPLSNLMPGGR